jgi:hypothetical protein
LWTYLVWFWGLAHGEGAGFGLMVVELLLYGHGEGHGLNGGRWWWTGELVSWKGWCRQEVAGNGPGNPWNTRNCQQRKRKRK